MAKQKFKIELNSAGIRSLLRSPEMEAVVGAYGAEMAARAGDGYRYDTYVGRNRVNSAVFCDSSSAEKDNFTNNTLLKSMR